MEFGLNKTPDERRKCPVVQWHDLATPHFYETLLGLLTIISLHFSIVLSVCLKFSPGGRSPLTWLFHNPRWPPKYLKNIKNTTKPTFTHCLPHNCHHLQRLNHDHCHCQHLGCLPHQCPLYYKWHAVAVQTTRCRSKSPSIPYVYYFRA